MIFSFKSRKVIAVAVVVSLVAVGVSLVVVGVVALVLSTHHAPRVHSALVQARQKPPQPNSKGFIAQPAGSFSVVTYGADSTGSTDSSAGIQAAISAAKAKGGWQTVYFPTGTYLLEDNDGAFADLSLKKETINILGAGPSYAKIVQKVGTIAYPTLSRGQNVFGFSDMSDFYVAGLTIDSQTYNAGDTIDDFGDDSTLQDLTLLGAKNGNGGSVDPDNVFDLRVLAECNANPGNPLYGVFNTGNIVKNVTLDGRGTGGNDDLDFSCQHDGTISDITDTGWGTAIYIDKDVTVSGFTFTPGVVGTNSDLRGFYITDSHDITIKDFTSYGEGGAIQTCVGHVESKAACLSHPSTDITINGEQMKAPPGYNLIVSDATDVTIENSLLGGLELTPYKLLDGLTVKATTYRKLHCEPMPGGVIEDLTGIECPS